MYINQIGQKLHPIPFVVYLPFMYGMTLTLNQANAIYGIIYGIITYSISATKNVIGFKLVSTLRLVLIVTTPQMVLGVAPT